MKTEYQKRRRRQWGKRLLFGALLTALVYWAAHLCRVDWAELASGIPAGLHFLSFMFPPDLAVLAEMVKPALDTVLFAFLATLFGAFLSFGLALAAAANVAPPWLRHTARLLIAFERALPEIIILLLLVAALGLGPFPGVVALSLGCVGMLGRLFADAIEEVNPRALESIASVGANKLQVIAYGIIPKVLPSLIANTIFRFEVNIRLSVLLGAVGAGGIGYEMFRAFSLMQYEQATTAILVTLALVFLSERLSTFLRRKITPQATLT